MLSRRLELGLDLTSAQGVHTEPLDPTDKKVQNVLGSRSRLVAEKVSKLNSAKDKSSTFGGGCGLLASLALIGLMLLAALFVQRDHVSPTKSGTVLLELMQNLDGPPSDMLSGSRNYRHMNAKLLVESSDPQALEAQQVRSDHARTMNGTSPGANLLQQKVMRKSTPPFGDLELDEGATDASPAGAAAKGTTSVTFVVIAVLLGLLELMFIVSSTCAYWEVQSLVEELEAQVADWNKTMHPLHFSIAYQRERIYVDRITKGACLIIENRSDAQKVTYQVKD